MFDRKKTDGDSLPTPPPEPRYPPQIYNKRTHPANDGRDERILANEEKALPLHLLGNAETGSAKYQFQYAYLLECKGGAANARIAFQWYKKAADQQYALAELHVGLCYLHGIGVRKDLDVARKYFNLAAKQKLYEAEFFLGSCMQGADDKRTQQTARMYFSSALLRLPQPTVSENKIPHARFIPPADIFQSYKDSAIRGSASDQYHVARCYEKGIGTQSDYYKAHTWYMRSASQQFPDAFMALGQWFEEGTIGPANPFAAFYWYMQAVHAQYPEAFIRLGEWSETGKMCVQNKSRAYYWYLKAAFRGSAIAKEKIKTLFLKDKDIVENFKLAIALDPAAFSAPLQSFLSPIEEVPKSKPKTDEKTPVALSHVKETKMMAADKTKSMQDHYDKGLDYLEGKTIPQDKKKAVIHLQLAALDGHREAQFRLATCYEESKEIKAAFHWYQEAGKQKHALALFKVGQFHETGPGDIPRNKTLAIENYKVAAHFNLVDAEYKLGQIYAYVTRRFHRNQHLAFIWFERAAEHGHVNAQSKLALMYHSGSGVAHDEKKAIEWFEKAAAHKDLIACKNLSSIYRDSTKGHKDAKKAFEWCQKSAEYGDMDAYNTLGIYYENGLGTPVDEKKAVECYQTASEKNITAKFNLARCIQFGRGTAKDEKKAFDLFEDNSKIKPHKESQCALAWFHETGTVVPRDDSKAFNLYQQSANQGYAHAQFKLAQCHEAGRGIRFKNSYQAYLMYHKAALQGHCVAEVRLAEYLESGKGLVKKDAAEALSWYQKASDLGHPHAQYRVARSLEAKEIDKAVALYQQAGSKDHPDANFRLAQCLEQGKGIGKDEKAAFQCYQKAALKEHRESMHRVALCYQQGTSVQQDDAKAYEWHLKAAEHNHAASQLFVAEQFEKKGTVKDLEIAFNWYHKSATQNNAMAEQKVSQCFLKGTGTPLDKNKAYVWMEKAAKQGNVTAMRELGMYHETGIGTPQNLKTACKWYEEAALRGDATAQYQLATFLEKGGNGIGRNTRKAVSLFEKAAAQQFQKAIDALARRKGTTTKIVSELAPEPNSEALPAAPLNEATRDEKMQSSPVMHDQKSPDSPPEISDTLMYDSFFTGPHTFFTPVTLQSTRSAFLESHGAQSDEAHEREIELLLYSLEDTDVNFDDPGDEVLIRPPVRSG